MVSTPRGARRAAAVLLAILGLACSGLGAGAEDAPAPPPAVRQIAPGFIPLYNLGDPAEAASSGQPAFELKLPSGERPLGGCDRAMARAVFGRCLAATLDLSRRALDATVLAAQKTVEARSDLPDGHRTRWIRLLDEVQLRWKEARNLECSQLVFLERGPKANIFEERAQCLLAAERDRIADLKRRYGVE
jgi:uncharacterized protein YecT (DUF1311 family)